MPVFCVFNYTMEKRKCKTCNNDKDENEYYKERDKICKDCRKEEERKKRQDIKNQEIPDVNYICNGCGINKYASNFRPSRKKCRDCERKHGRNYRKSDIGKNKAILWSEENKEIHKKLQSEWYQNNKPKIYKKYNDRLKNDVNFKLKVICKGRICMAIKKEKSTDKYIGCGSSFLKEWLQFCMKKEMTFDNHGKIWHLDHVIPINKFNLNDENKQNICFNWKNISPEFASYNIKKGDNIINEQVLKHIDNLVKFHRIKNIAIPYTYIGKLLLNINF
jgi:hypothetical protein